MNPSPSSVTEFLHSPAPTDSGSSMQGVFVVSMALVLLTGVIIWAASTNGNTKSKSRRRKRAIKHRRRKATESAYVNSQREDPPSLPQQQLTVEPNSAHHAEHVDPGESHADTQHDVKGRVQISSLERALTNLDGDHDSFVAPSSIARNGFEDNFEVLDKEGFDDQWAQSVNHNLSKSDVTTTALSHRGLTPSSSAGENRMPSRLIGMSVDAHYKALKPLAPRNLDNAKEVPFGGSQFFSSLLAKHEKKA
jgi:hypothetical protein